ncbi:MAG: biopolymer transporter ExbD [Bacteroidales bacterium]|jgi:biopolymer transport protein ExbD|nr:biopolymer transporter ExbD [Bacteroidales bacterium]
MARKSPGINTGSMADISFLLLTFFLLTSSINTEQGIPRRLPPPKDKNQKEEIIDINKRNLLDVKVSFNDEIVVNGEVIGINELKNRTKEFFANPFNLPHLPVKQNTYIENLGDYAVSKGVVSLTNDQGTSYNMYVQVQNELQRAVNELRDEVSSNFFGKKYDLLDTMYQNAVKKAVPQNISEAPPVDFSKAN